MPKRRPKNKRGKIGGDGLTDLEREFVLQKRADPAATGAVIAARAGYHGDRQDLNERARVLMRKPAVALAVTAPRAADGGVRTQTDEELKTEIRERLLRILRSQGATDADAIKAADKLLATITGGYVPVQAVHQGTFTLESWVRQMGGAPPEQEAN